MFLQEYDFANRERVVLTCVCNFFANPIVRTVTSLLRCISYWTASASFASCILELHTRLGPGMTAPLSLRSSSRVPPRTSPGDPENHEIFGNFSNSKISFFHLAKLSSQFFWQKISKKILFPRVAVLNPQYPSLKYPKTASEKFLHR